MILAQADTLIPFFEKNEKYFKENNIFSDGFRKVGWWLVKMLKKLADISQGLFDKVFSVINITSSKPIKDFLEELHPLAVAIVCLAVLAIGMMLMFKNEKLNINPLLSIFLFFMVAVSGTSIITELNSALKLGKAAIEGEQSISSNEIIKEHVYDLIYIDKEQGLATLAENKPEKYETLSNKQIEMMDITEVINPNSQYLTTDEGKNILGKKLYFIYGESQIIDVYNGYGWNSQDDADFGNEFYYRYEVEFLPIFISLLIIVLVYFCSAFKEAQFIYNILAGEILSIIFSGEISNNTKVKKLLIAIRDTYISILFVILNIRFYIFLQSYISNNVSGNTLTKLIIELFFAIAVIDGPNVMEIITGRDVGMKSGLGILAAGAFGARMTKSGIKEKITGMKGVTRSVSDIKSKFSGNKENSKGSEKNNQMPGAASGKGNEEGDKKNNQMPGKDSSKGNEKENKKNNQMPGATSNKGNEEGSEKNNQMPGAASNKGNEEESEKNNQMPGAASDKENEEGSEKNNQMPGAASDKENEEGNKKNNQMPGAASDKGNEEGDKKNNQMPGAASNKGNEEGDKKNNQMPGAASSKGNEEGNRRNNQMLEIASRGGKRENEENIQNPQKRPMKEMKKYVDNQNSNPDNAGIQNMDKANIKATKK